MKSPLHERRLEKCSSLMTSAGLDVLLLVKPANMYYLTGDGRLCSYAMVTNEGRVALGVPKTDVADVGSLAHFDQIAGFEDEVGMIHSIAANFAQFGIREGKVGLEYTFLTTSMMGMLTHPHAKPEGLVVENCTPIMAQLRIVKESEEIDRIRSAAKVAGAGMAAAIKAIKPGMTESQVAAEAEYAMRQAGAEDFYRSYISSGPRTSVAHGFPSTRRLEEGELVMIDIHPVVNGYSADICRTVCLGEPNADQQRAYDVYLRAQQSTIARAAPGATMVGLGETLAEVITGAGYGESLFGPTIHGVGIEFEEPPLPPGHAFFHGEKEPPPLEANVVISVGNCGLYAGPWAVRVEDTVWVSPEGPVTLTEYPRSLAPR